MQLASNNKYVTLDPKKFKLAYWPLLGGNELTYIGPPQNREVHSYLQSDSTF